MSKHSKSGTIFFSSVTQAALFEEELKGQFSDGYWENSRPNDHWKFWCDLDVRVHPAGQEPRVETSTPWAIKKRSYGISKLYECVGDRMLAIGRLARATLVAGVDIASFPHGDFRGAAEDMPATLEEWRQCKASGKWKYDFVGRYMERITDELAVAFYAASYTQRDLSRDVAAIKKAMANVVTVPAA